MRDPNYDLPNCSNLDEHQCYSTKETCPDFQSGYAAFHEQLKGEVNKGESKTYYKFGDGDYYFLKEIAHGSASPGKRALSVPYSKLDMGRFREGVKNNDYYMVELYPENRQKFRELYPNLPIDFPAEYTYASVTSRWATKTFAGKIGVLGGSAKIEIIRELMKHSLYRDYLGLESFNDYISIPEKFACDDIDATINSVKLQLAKATSKIFLVGIGHTKNGLLHELKNLHPAVYLDVGTGINALAGIVSLQRPYCGSWTNHLLPDEWAYNDVDMMDYHDTEGQNRVYLP